MSYWLEFIILLFIVLVIAFGVAWFTNFGAVDWTSYYVE